MKSAIYTAELGSGKSGSWVIVSVITQHDGQTLANLDGTVRSLQPGGEWETRPKGTAGPYELVAVNGGTVAYWPAPTTPPRIFPFQATVPNS